MHGSWPSDFLLTVPPLPVPPLTGSPPHLMRPRCLALSARSGAGGHGLDEGDETLALERQREIGQRETLQRGREREWHVFRPVIQDNRSARREPDTLQSDVAGRLQRRHAVHYDEERWIGERQDTRIMQAVGEYDAVASGRNRLRQPFEQRVVGPDQNDGGHCSAPNISSHGPQ